MDDRGERGQGWNRGASWGKSLFCAVTDLCGEEDVDIGLGLASSLGTPSGENALGLLVELSDESGFLGLKRPCLDGEL